MEAIFGAAGVAIASVIAQVLTARNTVVRLETKMQDISQRVSKLEQKQEELMQLVVKHETLLGRYQGRGS